MKNLRLGDIAPNFSANDHNGNTFILSEIIKTHDVLLFFYRGQWCPICNIHLSKIQKNLNKLKSKNIIALAITPEKQENIDKTIMKTNISIPIIFDEDYKIMKDYKVDFKPNIILRFIYNNILGAKLKSSQSDESETLPVPATYLIGKERKIKFVHFNRNYMNRASIDVVLKKIGS